MTNLNPLFDAMNNIDDNIIINAEKTNKKPIFLRIGIVAAAAFALVVGIRNWSGKIGNYISPEDSSVKQGGATYQGEEFSPAESGISNISTSNRIIIPEDFTPLNLTIPDDFYKYGEIGKTEAYEENKIHYYRDYTFHYDDISSMFEDFGFFVMIDENFTEEGNEPLPYIFNEDEPLAAVSEIIDVPDSMRVNFNYNLYDKAADKLIHFSAVVISGKSDRDYFIDMIKQQADKEYHPNTELIALNDGSICCISYDEAMTFHNSTSTFYNISIYDPEKEEDCSTIKQVLADLGVL